MTTVMLAGLGAGAFHAVSGPDHLLSLGPAALAQPRRAGQIGLLWGLGHALGTLLLALPLWLISQGALPEIWAHWGEKGAGLALMVLGILQLRGQQKEKLKVRTPWLVGTIHGLTGAASVVLMAPFLAQKGAGPWFLAAFAVGSTLAMAGLTHILAKAGRFASPARVAQLGRGAAVVSVGLGLYWLIG